LGVERRVCKYLLSTPIYEPTDDGMGEMQTGYDYECSYRLGDVDFNISRDCPYLHDESVLCPLKEEVLSEMGQRKESPPKAGGANGSE